MIKFFRQIRQRLLLRGNTGRYLKYALGEIILVVIGILIALQINNWNENRVIKVQEEKILEALLVDLRQAKVSSLESLEAEKRITEGIISFLSGVEKRDSMANSTSADSLYYQVIWPVVSEMPVINTYTDIKNAGQTSLISNENIRIKFTSLENSLNNLNNQANDRMNFQQAHSDRWAIGNMNFVRSLKHRLRDPNIDYGPENDYSKMFNDQNFLNLIAGKLTLSYGVIRDRNSLLDEINLLIELVENELKKN